MYIFNSFSLTVLYPALYALNTVILLQACLGNTPFVAPAGSHSEMSMYTRSCPDNGAVTNKIHPNEDTDTQYHQLQWYAH